MNEAIKEKWIEALESGTYNQGAVYLHAGNKFCALGVLCDLYVQEHEDTTWVARYTENANRIYSVDGHHHHIPPSVAEWAGLLRTDARLVSLRNDRIGEGRHSFSHLARWIRDNTRDTE